MITIRSTTNAKLINNSYTILLLTIFFIVFYIGSFIVITNTQTAYSIPSITTVDIKANGEKIPIAIGVGPPPNATNVPLNTEIVIFQLRSTKIENISLTPEGSIIGRSDKVEEPASKVTTFFPAIPLKPNTAFNISVTIADEYFSWVFTTTADSFQPNISYYLVTYAFGIATIPAVIGTYLIGKKLQKT